MVPFRMLQTPLVLLIWALSAQSLSIYSYSNIFEVVVPDVEDNSVLPQLASEAKEPPPPHSEVAKMARYVVHNSDWAVLAFRSLHPKTNDYPLGTVLSVSDGTVNNSSGTPYVYVSELEDGIQDTEVDPRCSFTMTLEQGDFCRQKKLDPQFPTCAQIWLVGRLTKKFNNEAEKAFAQDALFSRHPSMPSWPKDHNFFFMKLDIEQVVVQDYFGGPIYVNVTDYYKASP